MQQRGVRAGLKKNKSKGNLSRSKSKSRSPSPQKKQNKNNKKQPKTGKDNNKRNRSPSIARSRSKSPKKLGKSASDKKLKQRSSSLPRIGKSADKKNKQISRKNSGKNNSILRSPDRKVAKQNLQSSKKNESIIKQQEKDMGLIYYQPQFEKILLKAIDGLDSVHQKFLQMISNDNDASYVMNALPEFRDIRKQDDTSGRDFISGKITRLSGIFENLNVDKIVGPLKKVPMYYTGPCGKNLGVLKIGLQTKFKVQVDLGFLQYSLDGDKITIFRIYISKIYRRMNYIAFSYLQIMKALMEKHPAADRWSIFVLQRNQNVHKFFKYLGLKIDKIITDSKIKNQVEYYQQFTIKKRELQTAISSFK